MYNDVLEHIKVVVLPLDGTILDLNRYRYNYYHHLCESKNIEFTREDFYSHLSNMYDMYKNLPLSSQIDLGPFNNRIERELFQYLTYRHLQPKEGVYEIIEYFHQKNMKIAVISTHRSKDALDYLKFIDLQDKVDYVIGSDQVVTALPSSEILDKVLQYFHVNTSEALVISSFMALNYAANDLHMNVVYCEDLIKAGMREKETSLFCASSLFDVLNAFLFGHLEEAQLYSPILGMNERMSLQELDDIKAKLMVTYQDDPQIIDLIEKTYLYHVHNKEKPTIQHVGQFEDEIPQENNEVLQIFREYQKDKTKKTPRFSFEDEIEKEEVILEKEEPVVIEEEKPKVDTCMASMDPSQVEDILSLFNKINEKEKTKESLSFPIEEKEEDSFLEEEEEDEVITTSLLDYIVSAAYSFIFSLLLVFIGIVFYSVFSPQLTQGQGIFRMIALVGQLYMSFVSRIFAFLFNSLNAYVSFVPTYQDFCMYNTFLSPDGVHFFEVFFIQGIVISIIKIIQLKWSERYEEYEDD